MRFKRLSRSFYIRPTLRVAKSLLGKYLVRKIGTKTLLGRVVETEAYIGPKDRASHAYEGKITERCKTEYLEGGHIYIYLCYGMYWQLNITTAEAGKPECVLIRALEPVGRGYKIPNSKIQISNKFQISKFKIPKQIKNLANGPGKLCRWLKLNKSFDGEDLVKSKRIWLAASFPLRRRRRRTSPLAGASPERREDHGEKTKKEQIIATKRIGIDYAGSWAKKPWRFYISENPFVSKK